MSLFTPASGLLKTHVTWGDVEVRLQQALKTAARLGKERSIAHIGQGNGFMSRMGLITCDWEGANEGEELPARIALKMSTMMASMDMSEQAQTDFKMPEGTSIAEIFAMMEGWTGFVKQCHNTEVDTYRVLNSMGGNLAVPKCYYTVPFSDENKLAGSLALEYFDAATVYSVDENMTLEQIKQIARALGKMQGASVKYGAEKEASLANDVWSEYWKNFEPAIYEQSITQIREHDETIHESLDAAMAITPLYFGSNLAMTIHEQIGCGRVLVHGGKLVSANSNFWSANFLFDAQNNLLSIVDWQLGHLGVGVEDLLRITISAMSSAARREHTPALLNEMYDSMEEHLEGAKAPYTREQLFELHSILFVHAAFFVAPVLTRVFLANIKDTSSEEDKQQRKAVVRGMSEDILFYHKKNEERGLNLKWKPE